MRENCNASIFLINREREREGEKEARMPQGILQFYKIQPGNSIMNLIYLYI